MANNYIYYKALRPMLQSAAAKPSPSSFNHYFNVLEGNTNLKIDKFNYGAYVEGNQEAYVIEGIVDAIQQGNLSEEDNILWLTEMYKWLEISLLRPKIAETIRRKYSNIEISIISTLHTLYKLSQNQYDFKHKMYSTCEHIADLVLNYQEESNNIIPMGSNQNNNPYMDMRNSNNVGTIADAQAPIQFANGNITNNYNRIYPECKNPQTSNNVTNQDFVTDDDTELPW